MSELREIAAGVRLLALRTPTLPPATATNTLVVGHRRLAVIEPATPFGEEQAALNGLLDALAGTGAEVAAILLTHHHQDHTGYATALRERTGAPIHAHALTAARLDFPVDVLLADGQEVALDDGFSLAAMYTPGHAPGHLVFCERRTGLAYAGDLVAGTGTILIDPEDDGDMIAYLASLERVAAAGPVALIPAHGPVLDDPQACLARYRAHRLMREQRILAAISSEWRAVSAILAEAYADTPVALWPLAASSLEAHLRKLDAEGRVLRRGADVSAAAR
ncbi:MAG: MBL fold metallo-hydrolase [Nannocystis sp.]|nr:MBL fold metallo-hydrolase [Nannocystis sp.]MBA3545825.1 MBL fold metallo-hydrolase [Nannocystis sp.]